MERVAVIGAGSFGAWLARQNLRLKRVVKVYDVNHVRLKKLETEGAETCRTLDEVLEAVEAVIIAVPLKEAVKVLREAGEKMEKGVLAEVSSLKLPLMEALRSLPPSITSLALHPLFGPEEEGFEGRRVALIPVRDLVRERKLAEELMPGAVLVEVSAEEHDRAMAHILSLTHILSLASSHALKDAETHAVEKLAGTSFKALRKMMKATLSESPEVFTSILMLNRWSYRVAEEVYEAVEKVLEALEKGDEKVVREMFRRSAETLLRLGFPRKLLQE